MPIELWLTFVAAASVVLTIPGPTVMLVASFALVHGRQSGWATVPGVALGDITAMTVSLLGAGTVLAASATLFTLLKLAGAVYLIWLGIKLWRSTPTLAQYPGCENTSSPGRMFWQAYLVTALNPKSIVFFVAFVPQFIDTALPVWPQFLILEATFVSLAVANVTLWALVAGKLKAKVNNPGTLSVINRTSGGVLVGAGVMTAAARHS
ncbi:MAG TPA: lysine transporter LysE [Gammaproteobacteria bacterium]|nr:lysine transporter LysE [Gammaproteobacteria bacterium]